MEQLTLALDDDDDCVWNFVMLLLLLLFVCRYAFRTMQGDQISDILTDYAMALLKELGMKGSGEESKTDGVVGIDSEEVTQERAATKMQAMFRGYRLRRDLEYDYAAVRVQVCILCFHCITIRMMALDNM